MSFFDNTFKALGKTTGYTVLGIEYSAVQVGEGIKYSGKSAAYLGRCIAYSVIRLKGTFAQKEKVNDFAQLIRQRQLEGNLTLLSSKEIRLYLQDTQAE